MCIRDRISTTQGLISSFISTGFSMLTTYVGISQVLKGEMTLGGFMAFSTLSSYFTSPLSNLIGLQMQIQEASISMKRLGEIMEDVYKRQASWPLQHPAQYTSVPPVLRRSAGPCGFSTPLQIPEYGQSPAA